MAADHPVSFSYALQDLGIDEATSFEEANEQLIDAGLSDGLPLVPPTEQRIERFFWGVAADPNDNIEAMLMPAFRSPRLWEVAANAVMAGCLPSYLPVVVAALRAMAHDAYNLLGVQTTTGTATPIIAVHGPIAAELGVNGADNCLGQGNRANATIGRAVRLALQNLGDAFPGVSDMATMGQPGKYSWCFAENEAASPFPPYHVDTGMPVGSNAVTVMAAAGSSEVVLQGSSAEDYAACFGNAMRTRRRDSQALVMLPPEPANLFFPESWDRKRWREAIFASTGELTEGSADNLLLMVAGGVGIKATFVPSWGFNSQAVTREIVPL
jgi:hypothetical protein